MDCSENKITKLSKLPPNLKILCSLGNNIKELLLHDLPKNLQKLNICNNHKGIDGIDKIKKIIIRRYYWEYFFGKVVKSQLYNEEFTNHL